MVVGIHLGGSRSCRIEGGKGGARWFVTVSHILQEQLLEESWVGCGSPKMERAGEGLAGSGLGNGSVVIPRNGASPQHYSCKTEYDAVYVAIPISSRCPALLRRVGATYRWMLFC